MSMRYKDLDPAAKLAAMTGLRVSSNRAVARNTDSLAELQARPIPVKEVELRAHNRLIKFRRACLKVLLDNQQRFKSDARCIEFLESSRTLFTEYGESIGTTREQVRANIAEMVAAKGFDHD